MNKLDRTKAYYLGDLSEHQRDIIYDFLLSDDESFSFVLKSDFVERGSDYVFYNENKWSWYGKYLIIKLLELDEVNALTLFEPIKDWTPKQGDKVLWRARAFIKFEEGVFVCKYGDYFLIESGSLIHYGREIKPFIKSFKKGDWVKYKYNGETFFTQCKEDVENNNLTLVEDLQLIELLNKNKSLA